MMKVLLGRVLPMGAAIALLSSSASPLRPALNAFTHAANALGGAQNVDTSDVVMPDEESVNAAIGGAASGGFSLGKMFQNLFGPSESDKAKAQLDQIIASVKGRSANGHQGLPVEGLPSGTGGKGTGTAKAPATGKGGKTGAGKTAGKGTGKGGTGKSLAGPAQPAADPAAPAGGGSEGQAAAGGDEGGGGGGGGGATP
ncbi:MAG TPA: hypothetical protein VGK67_32495 [Myxococcales bacterium]|jgi:hypothetical protein